LWQTKGLGTVFQFSAQISITSISCGTDVKTHRRNRRSVSSLNQSSIKLSYDEEGVCGASRSGTPRMGQQVAHGRSLLGREVVEHNLEVDVRVDLWVDELEEPQRVGCRGGTSSCH